MTNPTNPFNWQMPTASDLVTDLPADFEVFGQAVATSMADLLGGTTGQVLSKASNTDMDFTWVAQDDSNAIQNSIVNAKGDLIAASANDTPAILSVGSNGQTLVADSSTATGLKWATPAAGGGMTLLSTTTLSGASVTISSIDQTYTNLYAFIYGMTNATADGNFVVRPNNLTSAYYGTTLTATTFGSIAGGGVNYPIQPRTSTNNAYTLNIPSYTNASVSRILVDGYGSNDSGTFQTWGVLATGSAVTSLVFLNVGGNFSGGTVLLYGVK